MGIDGLLKLLNEKIDSLQAKKEREEHQLDEIQQLQTIVRRLQNNPFELYQFDNDEINNIFTMLSLGKAPLEELEKYRVIYEGYLQFGREAIPQIKLVEDFSLNLKEKLSIRKYQLLDAVAGYQHTVVQYDNYYMLKEELASFDKTVSSIELLNSFFMEQGLKLEDQIAIKLEINSKNNSLYERQILSDSKKEVKYSDECEFKIQEINNKLEGVFNPLTLNNLNAISNLLSSCKSREDIEQIMNEWSFSFGDNSSVKIIEGLIDLKNIELLILKTLIAEEKDDYSSDLDAVNIQIKLLEGYKNDMQTVNELEDSSTVVDTADVTKFQKMLSEYNEDPLASPKCVLFLTDSIDRDIKAIDDRETLEDIFLLIEQLKQGEVELGRTVFKNNKNLKGLEEIKPISKGRQARVVGVRLNDNIYGILHLSGKKADNPKSRITTLESRRKSCDVDYLIENITEPQILDYYVSKTKNISAKLKHRVSEPYGSHLANTLGGMRYD